MARAIDREDGAACLSDLVRRVPLGDGWQIEDPFFETLDVADLRIHLVGLVAARGDDRLVGAAGSIARLPWDRAYFELVERCGIVDAMNLAEQTHDVLDPTGRKIGTRSTREVFPRSPEPTQWVYSRSNGVAVHRRWREACEAAQLELIERDRVLRSWLGQTRPARARSLPREAAAHLDRLNRLYHVKACSFPATERLGERAGRHVGGVFAFPRSEELPLSYGFGAGRSEEVALARAAREMLQRLGFLWGEEIPAEAPSPSPSPEFHQEYYLNPATHDVLRAWLEGLPGADRETTGCGPELLAPEDRVAASFPTCAYVDLTPAPAKATFRLVKALPRGELPLVFGCGYPPLAGRTGAHAIHPIP